MSDGYYHTTGMEKATGTYLYYAHKHSNIKGLPTGKMTSPYLMDMPTIPFDL